MNTFPVIDLEATGRRLEALRVQNNLSVRDIQEYLGLSSVQAVYKWQYGKSLPTVDNLLALAVLFQVHIEDLLAYSGREIHFLWEQLRKKLPLSGQHGHRKTGGSIV